MNTVSRKEFHPFRWFLALLGWRFGWRYVKDHNLWRWGFHRIGFDPYDYDMGPAKDGKQRLVHISSETYWFGKPCRKLAFVWEIDQNRRSLRLQIGIPWLCVHYLKFSWHQTCWFAKLLRGKYPNNIEYGLLINNHALSWNWANDTMDWCADGSTGFHYYLYWDKFRERPKTHKIVYWTVDHPFTMPASRGRPESQHVMTIAFEDTMYSFKRPWNRNYITFYANVSFTMDREKGILHPPPAFSGKGENSWDCDDDGIYGCSILIPEEGVLDPNFTKQNLFHTLDLLPRKVLLDYVANEYIQMVIKNRKRYG